MAAPCDEVERGGSGREGGCPWIRPRYNLICCSRKEWVSECERRERGREGGRMWEKSVREWSEGECEKRVWRREMEGWGLNMSGHRRENGDGGCHVASVQLSSCDIWYLHLYFFPSFFPYSAELQLRPAKPLRLFLSFESVKHHVGGLTCSTSSLHTCNILWVKDIWLIFGIWRRTWNWKQ